ncbi:hypothetical protein [Streptomyces aureoversilis]|uniref:Uncharacterized protein n=1 Tax=Streptomyces aureoversilis TaxID=67277 RepID=A0ABV9ZTI9_9ACTN
MQLLKGGSRQLIDEARVRQEGGAAVELGEVQRRALEIRDPCKLIMVEEGAREAAQLAGSGEPA